MQKFSSRIERRSTFYIKFRMIIENDFADM